MHAWDEVWKLTGRVIELEPSRNFLAYEYDAAANLNLRNLDAAEKSGLRAAALDRSHKLFWIDTEQTVKEPPGEDPKIKLLEQARGIGALASPGQLRTVATPLQPQLLSRNATRLHHFSPHPRSRQR